MWDFCRKTFQKNQYFCPNLTKKGSGEVGLGGRPSLSPRTNAWPNRRGAMPVNCGTAALPESPPHNVTPHTAHPPPTQ